jgi:hypothetical protein
MHEVDKEAEKVDASSLGSDGLRVIAHGIVGAESIIEYESRGGEAEGVGWRNPGHQHKKRRIANRYSRKGEATSLYPSMQRELHVEKRIDTLPTDCVPTVCSRLLSSSDIRMAARLHSAPRKTSHTLMHATFKIHDSQPTETRICQYQQPL